MRAAGSISAEIHCRSTRSSTRGQRIRRRCDGFGALVFLLFACVNPACGGVAVVDPGAGGATGSSASAGGAPGSSVASGPSGSGGGGASSGPEECGAEAGTTCLLTCAQDALFDYAATGTRLSEWNGRLVVAAAFENDQVGEGTVERRPVLISTMIQDGSFSMACPRSLSENYGYPSSAVYIDTDGDGRCTAADLGAQFQLYGWANDVLDTIATGTGWNNLQSPTKLQPPLGSMKRDFCTGYFD